MGQQQHKGGRPMSFATERQNLDAIRRARSARLDALNLTSPLPFDVILGLGRAVCSAERAVREFYGGQVAA